MEKTKRLPSPGTVIAVIALIVALGGSAYALKLKSNSVGPKQLKNNAVSTKKISDGAVTESKIADGVVGRNKLKSDEQSAWALVNGGTNGLIAQSGGVSVTGGIASGEYFVKFPVSVLGRAVVATLQAGQSSGEIQVGICGAPISGGVEQVYCNTTPASDNNPSVARIDTSTSGGVTMPRNFYVAVMPK